MKAVLMSIKNRHIRNIHSGEKTNELRIRAPKIECPFKVYDYDTETSGGCGKVVSEWICDNMTTWLLYMGIPAHLITTGCVSVREIREYTDNCNKNLTAMHISDLVIYDKPKELSDFIIPSKTGCVNEGKCRGCKYLDRGNGYNIEDDCSAPFCTDEYKPLRRAPQSWCYVEELKER